MRIKYKIYFETPQTLNVFRPIIDILNTKGYKPGFMYNGDGSSGTLCIDKKLESNEIKELESVVGKFSIKTLK